MPVMLVQPPDFMRLLEDLAPGPNEEQKFRLHYVGRKDGAVLGPEDQWIAVDLTQRQLRELYKVTRYALWAQLARHYHAR